MSINSGPTFFFAKLSFLLNSFTYHFGCILNHSFFCNTHFECNEFWPLGSRDPMVSLLSSTNHTTYIILFSFPGSLYPPPSSSSVCSRGT